MSSNAAQRYRLVVVAPVYDDAVTVPRLLAELAQAFPREGVELRVLLVDDGSPSPLATDLQAIAVSFPFQVDVLRLRRNVGHQRAIALGTAYLQEHIPCDAMLVMDADGEDRPADAARLVARCRELSGDRIVFAERTRRSESPLFLVLYRCYQLLHWLLTGIPVRVGNFSAVGSRHLAALVALPALWNHYAAAIFQAQLPRDLVPTARGQRYGGRSKMNFVALVTHGLQALSVFSDVVMVRLLLAVAGLVGCCGGLLVLTLATHSHAGLPPLAPYVAGGLLVVALCLAAGCFALSLSLLAQRNSLGFIPLRDYRFFIEDLCEVVPRHEP